MDEPAEPDQEGQAGAPEGDAEERVEEHERDAGPAGEGPAPDAEQGSSARRRKPLVLIAIAVVAALVVGYWVFGRSSSSLAERTCDQLEADGVTVAEAQDIYSLAVIESVGDEAGNFNAELRRECPSAYSIVKGSLGEGGLANDVSIDIDYCDSSEIVGTVENSSSTTVDIRLRYELTLNGTRVDEGLIFVDRVEGGDTARWDQSIFDRYSNCRVVIDSVLPS